MHTQGHNCNSDPRIEVLSKKRESSTFLLHGRRSSQDCGNGIITINEILLHPMCVLYTTLYIRTVYHIPD